MSKNLVVVLTRQLPNHQSVTTAVIGLPDEMKIVDDAQQRGYLEHRADSKRDDFIARFAEFRGATWTMEFIEMEIPYF